MQVSTKVKIIVCVCALVGTYALGRWMAPEKIKIETITVEVEKKVTDTDKDKHKETTIVKNPDGSETTKIIEDTHTDKHSTDDINKSTDTTKEVTKSSSKVHISALAGANLFSSQPSLPVYGASVSKDVLGPISIGVWGLTSGVAGASIGISF